MLDQSKQQKFNETVSCLIRKIVSTIQAHRRCIVNKSPYHVLDFTIFIIYTLYNDLNDLENPVNEHYIDDFLDISKKEIQTIFNYLENETNLLKLRFAEYKRTAFLSHTNKADDFAMILIKNLTADEINPIYTPHCSWEITDRDYKKTMRAVPKILKIQKKIYDKIFKDCTILFSFIMQK